MYRESFLGEFKEEKYTLTKQYLDSAIPNVRLYHTKFSPRDPQRTIAIIHGFGEHSGRFYEIAKFFASNNYEALLIDLTGFGYSGGPRGCSTTEMMINDVITLLTQARPELPLFIYAHSMGGMLTFKMLLARPQLKVSGCIITSPMLGLPADRHFPKAKLWFVKQMGDDLEDLIINGMINPTALTKNNKYLHNIFEDRLMLPFLSAKMAKSLFEGVDEVKQNMDKFNYPVIVFHGKQDAICNYKESKKFIESKLSQFRKLHLFERGYHELQHDEERDELLEHGLKFLEELP
jgi:acylglycerol lipase